MTRPSLTSGAATEERSIIEKHDRWVVWRYHWRRLETKVSVSGHPIYRKKCGNIGSKTKSYFSNMIFHSTENTATRHGNASQIIFVARTTTPKSLKEAFSPSQTCVYCFTCRLMCADMIKCAHFLLRKGICDEKHAEEPRAINGT